jgi:hypothetical protein
MVKQMINKYSISIKLKILIILSIIFDSNRGYAQEILEIEIEMSAEEGLSYMYQDLDPSEIPTGVLLDRIVPSFNYDLFLDAGSPPIITNKDWRSIYFDIQRATISTSSLPDLNVIEDESIAWLNQQIYPVYLAYFEFNDLHPNAYQNEWIIFDGQRFQDGPGNGQDSRLRDYNILKATTFRTTIWKTEAIFRISNDLYYSNTSHVPLTIEIDFDDGQGYRTYNLSSVNTETINWGSSGIKEINIKAHFSGFSRESRFTVNVSDMNPAPDLYVEGLNAPLSYEGVYAGYSYYVFLGDGNATLRRPIIITDGFDPVNTRLVDGIFDELNDNQNNQYKIASDLLSAGYDIIIMDFMDATTYIQANAFALVDLINIINDIKTTNEELIVIGPSMGALVVQYALAYMSHNNLDHQTRLMISFDGAHQGANLPIGVQLAIMELQEEHAMAKQSHRILSRPAPRQLLMYSTFNVFTVQADPLRANLYSELHSMGRYPTDIRKIAISKGSGYGLRQLDPDYVTRMNPGDLIFEAQGGIPLLAKIKLELYAARNQQYGTILKTPTKLEIKKFLGIPYSFSLHQVTWNLSNTLPYDSSPGGYAEFLSDSLMKQQLSNISVPIPAYFYGSIYFTRTSFVPTISSLDLNTTSLSFYELINNNFRDQDLTYNINQDSNPGSRTPFDAYYYPVENLSHLGVNQEIYDFIMEEIGPPTLFFNQNVTIADATIIEENQRVIIDDGIKVIFNESVTVNKGSKWILGHNTSIEFNGSVSIIGTQSDPIVFKNNIGSSRWNNIVSLAGNSFIEWSVFRGGDTGLHLHGSNNQITNSAFRYNNRGLWLSSVSGTTLTNSVIENNTQEGLLVFDSGHSGNSISYNTITGNGQAGVYLYNSEIRDFHGNVIETNNTRGVEVLAGSNLFMQEYLGNPPNDKGLNRVRNNNTHQVYITHSSRAFLGDSWFSTTNAGHNSVFHTSGPGTNRKYIYNLAVTGPGYSGTPYNILAQHSYWEQYPSSGMFHGPVDYTNYLWGSDPTTGSGAGSGQTPQQSIQSGHQSPIVNVLSAGMSGALASSYENPEHAVQALALKQRMMELRDLLASDEWHPHNARRLNELYTLSLLDTGDMLQESGNVEITLTTWADRGSSINSTYRDEEQVKLAIETALLIRVKQALRAGDYARAAALITGASPLIGNADHRMALMKHAISVYAYHGQHEAALDVLGQVRAIEPEKEVAAWYDAPNLRPVEVWLTDASKEKRPGGGAADLLAQVQYYGATESAAAGGGFSLGSNYPNPFNPSTIIPFELPADSRVHIEVYDLLGRLVATLSNDLYQAGAHQVVWDARTSASGVYLIRAVIEPQQVIYNRRQFTQTVTLLK